MYRIPLFNMAKDYAAIIKIPNNTVFCFVFKFVSVIKQL